MRIVRVNALQCFWSETCLPVLNLIIHMQTRVESQGSISFLNLKWAESFVTSFFFSRYFDFLEISEQGHMNVGKMSASCVCFTGGDGTASLDYGCMRFRALEMVMNFSRPSLGLSYRQLYLASLRHNVSDQHKLKNAYHQYQHYTRDCHPHPEDNTQRRCPQHD